MTSSLSTDELLPAPPPGSVVGVGAFDEAKVLWTVDDDDDMGRREDFVIDDLIERSSVATDDDKSVFPG